MVQCPACLMYFLLSDLNAPLSSGSSALTKGRAEKPSSTKITHNTFCGVKTPQLDNFIAICNALQVSADQLLQDVVDVSTTYTSNEVAKRLEQLPMDEQRKILRANWQTLSANGKKPTPEEFIASCALKMLSGRLANDRLNIRDP